jgi:hypothetical protein
LSTASICDIAVLIFSDESFYLQVMKEMLIQTFGVPAGHRAAKPFHDHIISFFYLDGRVWLRHYQVTVTLFLCWRKFQVSFYFLQVLDANPSTKVQVLQCFHR